MDHSLFIHEFVAKLARPTVEALERSRDRLIEENHRLGGPREGFLYGGVFHTNLQPKDQAAAPKKLLCRALRLSGQVYLEDLRTVEKEVVRMSHGLSFILRPCRGLQDIRDILTESLVVLDQKLYSMPRLREPGWALLDSPLSLTQYWEVIDLLETHASNQFL